MAAGGLAPGEATESVEGALSGAALKPVEQSPSGDVLLERSLAGDVGGAPSRSLVGQLRGGEVEPFDPEAQMQCINASNARNHVEIAMDAWRDLRPP